MTKIWPGRVKLRPGLSLAFTLRVKTDADGVLAMELFDETGEPFGITQIRFADGTEFRRLPE